MLRRDPETAERITRLEDGLVTVTAAVAHIDECVDDVKRLLVERPQWSVVFLLTALVGIVCALASVLASHV